MPETSTPKVTGLSDALPVSITFCSRTYSKYRGAWSKALRHLFRLLTATLPRRFQSSATARDLTRVIDVAGHSKSVSLSYISKPRRQLSPIDEEHFSHAVA